MAPRRNANGDDAPRVSLERVPIGWNHPIDKNSLQISKLEQSKIKPH